MARRLSIFCALFLFLFITNAYAVGTVIPASNRMDIVHDFNRGLLYISNGGQILRYDIGNDTFLDPLTLGGSLSGMDLSPDGNTLVVADSNHSDTHNWVYLVDLDSATWRKAMFNLAFSEGGTFAAAFGNDGKILVTSHFLGSGFVPLRRYDPATDTYDVLLPLISERTMVTASGDGTIIGFAESNISDGRWGRYSVATGEVVERTGYQDGTGWFNYEIGTKHDGTQYAIPTYGGTFFYSANFEKIGTIGIYAGPQPMGVVYHPVEDRVYFPWAETTEVREYDTTTLTEVAAYDFENNFPHPGNFAFVQGRMKISRDGSLLFATVSGGVRYLRLYDALSASDQAVETSQDTPTPIELNGSIGNGGSLNFTVDALPAQGTLAGVAPDLVYLPNPGFTGTDSFTYHVSYGNASVGAAVTVNVKPQ